MFIKDNKKEFYEFVISSRSRLLIYSCYELDSICATKILQYLLECDHIQHTIIPIKDKQQLFTSFRDHSDGVKVILLINIGSTFDVLDFLQPDPDVRIFICDTRRPIDVFNGYRDKVSIMSTITGLNSVEDETKEFPKYEELFEDSDNDDEDIDINDMSLELLEKREEKRRFLLQRQQRLFEYSKYSYHSYSSALLMFDLSWKLSKDNNELLWFAIIGVSDQMIGCRISETKSEQQYKYIKEAMTRLRNIRGEPTIALNNITTNSDQNVVTNNNFLTINYEKDLKLCLYRHWSLYESLRHTMYISSKFKIWKLRGHKRLLALLAELGLPLTQCKQKFSSMDLELRNNIRQWIEDLSTKYQLQPIIGHCFTSNRGFKHKYNCNDVTLGARALLESADRDKRLNQKFFDAIDCLSANNINLLEKGLDLAKLQMSAILKQVQIIVDSRQINLLNGVFWYTIISENIPDASLFSHSGCLNLLSQYVLHSLVATNPKSNKSISLPLILITPDPNPNKPGMALACGIPPINSIKNGKNIFSKAFSYTHFEDCQIELDLVDPSIAHLPYAQAMNFLNELSLKFD